MLDTMIYNTEADTILEGFGMEADELEKLVNDNLVGSRAEVLARLCNTTLLTQAQRYLLLIEFGTRLVFDEISIRQEELEKFNANQTDSGEGR